MKLRLEKNIHDIVTLAIGFAPPKKALIIFDRRSSLSNLLTDAYQAVLPEAAMIDFDATTPDEVRTAIDALGAGDLAVMVQSTSFRLSEFRFRIEMFKRGLAVIEHPHVGRIPPDEESTYIDALAYEPNYYRVVGQN